MNEDEISTGNTSAADKPYNSRAAGENVSKITPTVAHHLNEHHRKIVIQECNLQDLLRRAQQIEKFLGVDFTMPHPPLDVTPLDFTTITQ